MAGEWACFLCVQESGVGSVGPASCCLSDWMKPRPEAYVEVQASVVSSDSLSKPYLVAYFVKVAWTLHYD